MRRGTRFLRIAGLLFLAGVTWMWISPWIADQILFIPDRRDPGPAPEIAGIQGRDVLLSTDDGLVIHGWWHPVGIDAPAVLLLHGNAGNIANRIPLADAYLNRGVSIFMLDYRGYGRSFGSPSESGVYRDAAAALDFLVDEIGSADRVVVHGRSLGGAVAARAAGHLPVAGVILESTFTTLAEIARSAYPFLPTIMFRPLQGRFDTRSSIRELDVPVLITHGTADRLVPIAMGQELYEAALTLKEWYPIEGAGHNDQMLIGGSTYLDRLAEFVHQSVGLR